MKNLFLCLSAQSSYQRGPRNQTVAAVLPSEESFLQQRQQPGLRGTQHADITAARAQDARDVPRDVHDIQDDRPLLEQAGRGVPARCVGR